MLSNYNNFKKIVFKMFNLIAISKYICDTLFNYNIIIFLTFLAILYIPNILINIILLK